MQPRVLLSSQQISLTLTRLAHQLIEIHQDFSESYLIGIQPRGIYLASRIAAIVREITGKNIGYGKLDFTLHRDDLHRTDEIILPSETDIDFSIENKNVILVDDVLYSGRTIRASLDALMDYGRPKDVELLVMVDRRFHRHVPIQAKYIGISIDSIESELVKVKWKEKEGVDEVILI